MQTRLHLLKKTTVLAKYYELQTYIATARPYKAHTSKCLSIEDSKEVSGSFADVISGYRTDAKVF